MGESQRHRHQDVPANASDLRTPEDIGLERLREELRMDQEERKSLARLWQGFVAVLAILAVVAAVAAITAVVALVSGPTSLIVTALWVLAGAGGGSVFIWRVYAGHTAAG